MSPLSRNCLPGKLRYPDPSSADRNRSCVTAGFIHCGGFRFRLLSVKELPALSTGTRHSTSCRPVRQVKHRRFFSRKSAGVVDTSQSGREPGPLRAPTWGPDKRHRGVRRFSVRLITSTKESVAQTFDPCKRRESFSQDFLGNRNLRLPRRMSDPFPPRPGMVPAKGPDRVTRRTRSGPSQPPAPRLTPVPGCRRRGDRRLTARHPCVWQCGSPCPHGGIHLPKPVA